MGCSSCGCKAPDAQLRSLSQTLSVYCGPHVSERRASGFELPVLASLADWFPTYILFRTFAVVVQHDPDAVNYGTWDPEFKVCAFHPFGEFHGHSVVSEKH